MPALLTAWFETLRDGIPLNSILSAGSAFVTGYFWLVKMRQERAGLRLYQAAGFRPDRLQCSDVPGKGKATWYGEIFLANPSTLPSTVISLRISLFWKGQWIDGKRVIEKKDDLPWAVEPLRVLSRSLGCSFDVDEGTTREQLQVNQRLRLTLTTVDGRERTQELDTHGPAVARAA
jgi:hypothetical protein